MRAILFDVDGVVLHSLFHADPARRRRWDTHLLEDMGVEPAEFARFFDESFLAVIEGRKSLVTALEAFLPDIGYRGSPLATGPSSSPAITSTTRACTTGWTRCVGWGSPCS